MWPFVNFLGLCFSFTYGFEGALHSAHSEFSNQTLIFVYQVILVKNLGGGASLGFLAIHLSSPHAPPSQNNQIVTKVKKLLNHGCHFSNFLIHCSSSGYPNPAQALRLDARKSSEIFLDVDVDVGEVTWFKNCKESPTT